MKRRGKGIDIIVLPVVAEFFLVVRHLTYFARKLYLWGVCQEGELTIYSDKKGEPLDSYSKALGVLKDINTDMADSSRNFTFDDYKTSSREKYCLRTRFDQYRATKPGYKYQQQFKFAERCVFGYFDPSRDIREITQANIALWAESLEQYSKKGTLGGKAKKNIVGVLLAVLNHNCGIGMIPKKLIMPTIEITKKKKEIPDITDSFKIIRAIDVTDEELLIYLFLVTHPCRLSEARALQPVDFDFAKKTVTIQRSLEGTNRKDSNKTGNPYTIPLHSALVERLRDLCIRRQPTETVFKFQGKAWTDGTLRRKWNDATVKTGLKYQLYTGLKHACLSELANQSGEIRNAQKMAGHTSPKMTEAYAEKADMEKMRSVQSLIVFPEGL